MVECPACGRGFDSEYGMKQHHARGHGERLTTVTIECVVCGKGAERDRQKVEQAEFNYCSQDCLNEHKHERYSGDGNPRSTLQKVECATCGDEIQRPKWMRESRDRHFCDYECMGEWRGGEWEGKDNPRWAEYVDCECEYCGKAYRIKPSEAKRTRFCSRTCRNAGVDLTGENNHKWKEFPRKECQNCGSTYTVKPALADESSYCSYDCMHENAHPSGDDHHRWKGGTPNYYGPNWHRQRRKALIRDQARCQGDACGMSERESLENYGFGLDVHHITALREFETKDGTDYNSANKLFNLVTLCRQCHRKIESVSD